MARFKFKEIFFTFVLVFFAAGDDPEWGECVFSPIFGPWTLQICTDPRPQLFIRPDGCLFAFDFEKNFVDILETLKEAVNKCENPLDSSISQFNVNTLACLSTFRASSVINSASVKVEKNHLGADVFALTCKPTFSMAGRRLEYISGIEDAEMSGMVLRRAKQLEFAESVINFFKSFANKGIHKVSGSTEYYYYQDKAVKACKKLHTASIHYFWVLTNMESGKCIDTEPSMNYLYDV